MCGISECGYGGGISLLRISGHRVLGAACLALTTAAPPCTHAPAPDDICSTGHKGKFGHEFMEFEFRPDGRLRYANNSNYKNDTMIRKEGECPCASVPC
jgi:hypothetical protein